MQEGRFIFNKKVSRKQHATRPSWRYEEGCRCTATSRSFGTSAPPDHVRAWQGSPSAVLSKPTEWSVAFEAPGISSHALGVGRGSGRAYLLKNNRGVVLGALLQSKLVFRRFPECSSLMTGTRSIVGSCGQYLVDHYWGSYVASVHDSDRQVCHVLREPTGTVPCYRMAYHDIQVFFCWAEDCIGRLPLSFLPNRRYVSRWLIFSGSGDETADSKGWKTCWAANA